MDRTAFLPMVWQFKRVQIFFPWKAVLFFPRTDAHLLSYTRAEATKGRALTCPCNLSKEAQNLILRKTCLIL